MQSNKTEVCVETRQRPIHEQLGLLQGSISSLRDQWEALEKRLSVIIAPRPCAAPTTGGPKTAVESMGQIAESIAELRGIVNAVAEGIGECESRVEV
jgi:hypothetical protein